MLNWQFLEDVSRNIQIDSKLTFLEHFEVFTVNIHLKLLFIVSNFKLFGTK